MWWTLVSSVVTFRLMIYLMLLAMLYQTWDLEGHIMHLYIMSLSFSLHPVSRGLWSYRCAQISSCHRLSDGLRRTSALSHLVS
jgi:hypothetical protein